MSVHVFYVLEGEPALRAFTSTAIQHLCLALLLVATVTKAQSGVAAAARERVRDKGKNRERRRFLPVDLITTTDLTQCISSDTEMSEMSRHRKIRRALTPLNFVSCMHKHTYQRINYWLCRSFVPHRSWLTQLDNSTNSIRDIWVQFGCSGPWYLFLSVSSCSGKLLCVDRKGVFILSVFSRRRVY